MLYRVDDLIKPLSPDMSGLERGADGYGGSSKIAPSAASPDKRSKRHIVRLRGAPCPKALLDAASTLTRLEEDSHEIPIHHRRGWLACQLVCRVCRRCRQEKGPGDGRASG